MSSISGGFQSINASDYAVSEEAAAPSGGESAPAEATEGTVVRGGTPSAKAEAADALVHMKSSELQAKLMETGLTKSEAKEAAKEIKKTAAEVEKLEKELADLKETLAMYDEWLADPTLDSWDASWLEWDRLDVQVDIWDIEDELGKLEGTMDSLVGDAWDSVLTRFDVASDANAFKVNDQLSRTDKQIADEAVRARENADRKKILDRTREESLERLREKGLLPPVPLPSALARKVLESVTRKLEETKGTRTRDDLDALREQVRATRPLLPSKRI